MSKLVRKYVNEMIKSAAIMEQELIRDDINESIREELQALYHTIALYL